MPTESPQPALVDPGLPGPADAAAECLRTLAHPDRLRLLEVLLEARCPVTELAERCGLAQNAASMHLRLMRDRGLLMTQREGRRVYYRIAEPQLASIMACIWSRYGRLLSAGAIGVRAGVSAGGEP